MGRNMIVKIQKNSSFSFVRTDTHTHTDTQTQFKLDCVAKTSLSAQPKGCRLAAKMVSESVVSS